MSRWKITSRTTEKFWSKLRLDMAELKATDLPDGVMGPVVDYDFGDTVAVLIAIHGDRYNYRELKDYSERIEAAIRRIRAVSKVKRIDEQKEQMEVNGSLSMRSPACEMSLARGVKTRAFPSAKAPPVP